MKLLKAYYPWEMEFKEKSKDEMVMPFHIDNVTAEVAPRLPPPPL